MAVAGVASVAVKAVAAKAVAASAVLTTAEASRPRVRARRTILHFKASLLGF
ncbi:hypothetical protein D3C78_1845950 [compost metagenome]